MQSRLHLPEFREMAIEEAMNNFQFDYALQLAEEGEEQDEKKGRGG